MKPVLAAALAAVLLAVPVSTLADVYVRTRTSTTGFAGIGGTKGETEVWISGGKQAERSKMDFSSPLLRQFTKASKTRTVTDLERGVILEIDDREKTYVEVSFEDMMARMKGMQEQMRETYAGAESGGEASVPTSRPGEFTDVRVEVVPRDEEKKFAGIKARRSTLKLLSTGIDEETGEEVTFKIVYDAWMAPEFPGAGEFGAYAQAYAEQMGEMLTEDNLSLATALSTAGMGLDDLTGHMAQLQGYPMASTVTFGSVLTPEQRARMKELENAREEEDSGGGFGGLGGFGDKLKGKVEDKIAEKVAKSLFGEGISYDEDGDPVFFSMETEVKKVETKPVDPERFTVPEDYEKVTFSLD